MKRLLKVLCVVGLVSGGAQAETRTGELTSSGAGVVLDGTPLGLLFSGWSHNSINYFEMGWNYGTHPAGAQFVSLASGADYAVGDAVSSSGDQFHIFRLGQTDTSWPDPVHNFVGEVGEMYYIGFVFLNDFDSGNSFLSYGFLQLQKISENQFDWLGYAYETEEGVPIEIFNIPSPSGAGLLGLAVLSMTGRRRV